ncbi:MAG: hypothetical protein ACKO0Z_06825 [Betaproteobacteria bacterium]
MSLTRAAKEKIAARAIRAARFDATNYRSLSKVTLNDRPTAAHFADNAAQNADIAKTLKRRFFGKSRKGISRAFGVSMKHW